jgi:hypothetical protein
MIRIRILIVHFLSVSNSNDEQCSQKKQEADKMHGIFYLDNPGIIVTHYF